MMCWPAASMTLAPLGMAVSGPPTATIWPLWTTSTPPAMRGPAAVCRVAPLNATGAGSAGAGRTRERAVSAGRKIDASVSARRDMRALQQGCWGAGGQDRARRATCPWMSVFRLDELAPGESNGPRFSRSLVALSLDDDDLSFGQLRQLGPGPSSELEGKGALPAVEVELVATPGTAPHAQHRADDGEVLVGVPLVAAGGVVLVGLRDLSGKGGGCAIRQRESPKGVQYPPPAILELLGARAPLVCQAGPKGVSRHLVDAVDLAKCSVLKGEVDRPRPLVSVDRHGPPRHAFPLRASIHLCDLPLCNHPSDSAHLRDLLPCD